MSISPSAGRDETRSRFRHSPLGLAGLGCAAVFAALLRCLLQIREQRLTNYRGFCFGLTPILLLLLFVCHGLILPAQTRRCVEQIRHSTSKYAIIQIVADLAFYTAAEVARLLRLHPQVVQRKLQAGAIPGYRIGREWRVEHEQLVAWLEQHSNQRARTPEMQIVENFFTPGGRLRSIPAQRSKRSVVLERLAAEFEPARIYTEREVNTVLRRFHDDVATIRRELIAAKKLVRTKSGVYKRTATKEPALQRG